MSTKIRKGDTVIVVGGEDRGKKGKVLHIHPENGRVVVEGVNVRIRHTRPRKERQKGQRVEFSAPLNISNVMLLDPKKNTPTRIGYTRSEDTGKKQRITRKSGTVVD